jgi:hypothetical protein
MAIINFDARQVAPDEGRMGPVPAGWYLLAAKETKVEPTSDTLGTKLTAQFTILEGMYKGRTVYHNFNIKNNSEKAQEIGLKQLSALCHATRLLVVQDTSQLHNVPFKAKLKIVAAVMDPLNPLVEKYAAKNEITAFKDAADPSAVDAAGSGINLSAPAPTSGAAFTPPPVAAAPAAAPAQAAGGWAPPASQQPWQQPAPNAQPAPQAVQVQPTTIAPSPAPAGAPPAWANAPAQIPAQAPAQAPAQSAPPVTAAPDGQVMPPWMQDQPAQ